MRTIGKLSLHITGPGIVIYSPFAMAHVAAGTHFLEERFTELEDVGELVRAGRLAGFNMGSSLSELTWHSVPFLGDESAIDEDDDKDQAP